MLIGFTIVAAPLLFAIVNAAVQMNRLSNRSEQLVIHGMQGTRSNQLMFEQIGALERTARLYQIIGNRELLDAYAPQSASGSRRRSMSCSTAAARRRIARPSSRACRPRRQRLHARTARRRRRTRRA